MIGQARVSLTLDGQPVELRFTYYRPRRGWCVEFIDVEFLGPAEQLRRLRFDCLETAIVIGQAMVRRQLAMMMKGGLL